MRMTRLAKLAADAPDVPDDYADDWQFGLYVDDLDNALSFYGRKAYLAKSEEALDTPGSPCYARLN